MMLSAPCSKAVNTAAGIPCLSRLAGVREPRFYPAWRAFENPVFIPLGGRSRAQCLSRLVGVREPSVYPAWRAFKSPVFIPLGGRLRTQVLSRLAGVWEPRFYPAWRAFERPVFIPNGKGRHVWAAHKTASARRSNAIASPLKKDFRHRKADEEKRREFLEVKSV